jgi:hypothetical protein
MARESPASAAQLREAEIMQAKALALGARNGVEDLHAGPAGCFTDDQAPGFNRAMRARLYEALVALRLSFSDATPNHDWFEQFVLELLHEEDADREPFQAALTGACRAAAREFATGIGLSADRTERFEQAAIGGMLEHLEIIERASQDEGAARKATLMLTMIPSYWDDPAPSAEFRRQVQTAD